MTIRSINWFCLIKKKTSTGDMRGFVDDGAHEAAIKTINTGLTFFLSGNYSVDV